MRLGQDVDTKTVGKAFKVEINGQFLPIKSYTGGDPVAEQAPGAQQSGTGQIDLTPLTLVAIMTPDQKILGDAAHKVANLGKNERYTITITEMAKDKSVVKTFVYGDCLLASLDFPALNARARKNDYAIETATFRPQTIQVL